MGFVRWEERVLYWGDGGREVFLGHISSHWPQCCQAAALVPAPCHGCYCLVAQVSERYFILCRNGVAAKLKVSSGIGRNWFYRSSFIFCLFRGVKVLFRCISRC